MAALRHPWRWIMSAGLIFIFAAIGFAGYSVYRVGLIVRDAYSAENASHAVSKFIDKHKRPPGSWKELDSSIRDACAETGYNYENVIRNAKIDFEMLNNRNAWNSDARFISTETGAEFGSPSPNKRITDRLKQLIKVSSDEN